MQTGRFLAGPVAELQWVQQAPRNSDFRALSRYAAAFTPLTEIRWSAADFGDCSHVRESCGSDPSTVVLMCGLAFSGKTTLAKAIVATLGWAYISLDEINAERGLSSGRGISPAEWEKTHRIAIDRLGALLASHRGVVIDDTNCFRWIRERFTEACRSCGTRPVIVLLDTPEGDVEARIVANAERHDRASIAPAVFAEHVKTFERPAADEDILVYRPGDRADEWIQRHLR